VFWRWKSRRRGRPPLPKNIRDLIGRMAHENPTWGEERIANELKLKLGIHVSPRTVRKDLDAAPPRGTSGQRWNTFLRNHAKGIVASRNVPANAAANTNPELLSRVARTPAQLVPSRRIVRITWSWSFSKVSRLERPVVSLQIVPRVVARQRGRDYRINFVSRKNQHK
jgi:hypothetical protein